MTDAELKAMEEKIAEEKEKRRIRNEKTSELREIESKKEDAFKEMGYLCYVGKIKIVIEKCESTANFQGTESRNIEIPIRDKKAVENFLNSYVGKLKADIEKEDNIINEG